MDKNIPYTSTDIVPIIARWCPSYKVKIGTQQVLMKY
jgi:hypothetical protein